MYINRHGGVRTNLRRLALAFRSRRDLALARAEVDWFSPFETALPEATASLRDAHASYTTNISTPDMAVSLEVAAMLLAFCETTRPRRLIDLGSGFSSYVLRRYQSGCDADEQPFVKSVDDAAEWLEQTRRFLRGHDLSEEAVITVDELGENDSGTYDLVFHDVGRMPTRKAWLPRALDLARSGSGIVFLDDCHKPDYFRVCRDELRSRSCRVYNLRAICRDEFDRFDLLVTNLQG